MSRRGDNIHKRKDGRWEGRYKKGRKADGRILYGSVYGKTYKEVREKLQQLSATPVIEAIGKQKKKTFEEVLNLWMDHNRIRLKGGTINKYRNLIDMHIVPALGHVNVTEITSPMIHHFLMEKKEHGSLTREGGLSASYLRSIMLVINSALKFAAQEGLCQPLKSPVFVPSPPKKMLAILDLNEQRNLETYLLHDLNLTKAGVFISLHTGLRIGEVCALRWEDVDLEKKLIHVRHTVARIKKIESMPSQGTRLIIDQAKTKASVRDIPISSVLLPVMEKIKEEAASDYVISETTSFVSPRTYEYRYHRILETCGLPSINYHALRHTFATRCIEAGVDIKSLSEILGHGNVSITLNTYVHSSLDLKRTQLEKLTVLLA